MKKTTKLAGLAAGLLALVGVTFTSCGDLGDTFGKDYFLGTWETYDYVDNKVVPTYDGSGSNYRVIWKFNGNAENINDGGIFRQVIINYETTKPTTEDIKKGSVVPKKVNYWIGKYDLKANSGYDKGKYYMYFQINATITDLIEDGYYVDGKTIKQNTGDKIVTNKKIDAFIALFDTWNQTDFINEAYGNKNGYDNLKTWTSETHGSKSIDNYETGSGNKYIKLHIVRDSNKKVLCNDVEYFRYRLEDADATGFTRMMVTSIDPKGDGTEHIGKTFNQWKDGKEKLTITGNKVDDKCNWTGINTRYLGKISRYPENLNDPKWLCNNKKTNADLFKLLDASDDFAYAFDKSEK